MALACWALSIVAYLRRFHNRTACTLVPTEELAGQLRGLGFNNLRVLSRGVDTRLFSPSRRHQALRLRWGAKPEDPVLPFTALVALSRLVLGLHYPSDVLAGALLGAGLAGLVMQW